MSAYATEARYMSDDETSRSDMMRACVGQFMRYARRATAYILSVRPACRLKADLLIMPLSKRYMGMVTIIEAKHHDLPKSRIYHAAPVCIILRRASA